MISHLLDMLDMLAILLVSVMVVFNYNFGEVGIILRVAGESTDVPSTERLLYASSVCYCAGSMDSE
jgi:hypothetical protein